MASLKRYLRERLKLKVNETKSSVSRPWKSKFLGYSMTMHRQPRLKAAEQSVERFRVKVRQLCRKGRGHNLERFMREDLNPLLRGWANYYRKAKTYGVFEELDGWLRRKLRCMIWRRWKRPATRARRLMQLGMEKVKASRCAYNGRGPWWNAGASHMNAAFPRAWFHRMGLVSLLQIIKARA